MVFFPLSWVEMRVRTLFFFQKIDRLERLLKACWSLWDPLQIELLLHKCVTVKAAELHFLTDGKEQLNSKSIYSGLVYKNSRGPVSILVLYTRITEASRVLFPPEWSLLSFGKGEKQVKARTYFLAGNLKTDL